MKNAMFLFLSLILSTSLVAFDKNTPLMDLPDGTKLNFKFKKGGPGRPPYRTFQDGCEKSPGKLDSKLLTGRFTSVGRDWESCEFVVSQKQRRNVYGLKSSEGFGKILATDHRSFFNGDERRKQLFGDLCGKGKGAQFWDVIVRQNGKDDVISPFPASCTTKPGDDELIQVDVLLISTHGGEHVELGYRSEGRKPNEPCMKSTFSPSVGDLMKAFGDSLEVPDLEETKDPQPPSIGGGTSLGNSGSLGNGTSGNDQSPIPAPPSVNKKNK